MKLHLGFSGIVILGFLVSETLSHVPYQRQDKGNKSSLSPKEKEVVVLGDVHDCCKFYFTRDEEGEGNIHFACPKRPGCKYEPHDIKILSPQHNSSFKERSDFKCPFPWGTFPHPTHCSQYYLCLFSKRSLKRCNSSQFYDEVKQKCSRKETVDCGERTGDGKKKDTTTKRPATSTTKVPTAASSTSKPKDGHEDDEKEVPFKCPYTWGTFPHPKDCSKYYLCLNKNSFAKRCKPAELYDADEQECRGEDEVDCGSRYDPKEKTTTSSELRKSTISQRNKTTTERKEVSSSTFQPKIIDLTTSELNPLTSTNPKSTDVSTAPPHKSTRPEMTSTNEVHSTQSENSESTEDVNSTRSEISEVTTNGAVTTVEYTTQFKVSSKQTMSTGSPSDGLRTKNVHSTQTEELTSDSIGPSGESTFVFTTGSETTVLEERKTTNGVISEYTTLPEEIDGSTPREQTTTRITGTRSEKPTSVQDRTTRSTTFEESKTTESDSKTTSTPETEFSTFSSASIDHDLTSQGTNVTISSSEASTDISTDSKTRTESTVLSSHYPDSFTCPKNKRNFPHPEYCSVYFACRGGEFSVEECAPGTLFHTDFKVCYTEQDVDCGSRKVLARVSTVEDFSLTTEVTEDLRKETTTAVDDKGFPCPKKNRNFVHEKDCSLYYSCRQNVAELVQCLPGLLFSDDYHICLNESEVDCGSRAVTNREI